MTGIDRMKNSMQIFTHIFYIYVDFYWKKSSNAFPNWVDLHIFDSRLCTIMEAIYEITLNKSGVFTKEYSKENND